MTDVDRLARILWDYQRLGHTPRRADAAIVLGSHDIRVADRAVDLFQQGFAPTFVFSGGAAPATRRFYRGTEAQAFAERARERGMPASAVLLEERSTNTAENLAFSLTVLREHGIVPGVLLLVQKPYMERRSKATADVVCPGVEVVCLSPEIPFEDYAHGEVTTEHFVNTMVGDMQRVLEYPAMGYMSEQSVPDEVLGAYRALVGLGFTKRLL